jgi:hypothetical protein
VKSAEQPPNPQNEFNPYHARPQPSISTSPPFEDSVVVPSNETPTRDEVQTSRKERTPEERVLHARKVIQKLRSEVGHNIIQTLSITPPDTVASPNETLTYQTNAIAGELTPQPPWTKKGLCGPRTGWPTHYLTPFERRGHGRLLQTGCRSDLERMQCRMEGPQYFQKLD